MKKLIAAAALVLSTAAFAQRDPNVPIENYAEVCIATAGVCPVPKIWCVDYTAQKIYACDPFTMTWKKVGELDTGGPGGGVSDGNKGDISVTISGTVWTINASAVGGLEITDGSIFNADIASTANISPSKLDPSVIVSTEIDSSNELAAIVGDMSGTGGGIVRASDATILPFSLNLPDASGLPAACTMGDIFFLTGPTGVDGQRLHVCQTPNNWVKQGDGGGFPNATFILKQPDAALTNAQSLSTLATGVLKNTTGTGDLSIAGAADFPSLSGDANGPMNATIVDDNSHAHTGSTLSGIDISDDTNLSAAANQGLLVISGDSLGLISCAPGKILKRGGSSTWDCADDAGAVGGGITSIEEGNVEVTASATSIDFAISDFNVIGATGEGDISIDYTNAQAASNLTKGFLTSADWITFNNKLSTEVDGSTTNEIQNIFQSVTAPLGTGPSIAGSPTGVLALASTGIVTVSSNAATDTITIGGVEVNDLEGQDPTAILDDEVYVGNGPGSGTFVPLLSTCAVGTQSLKWNGTAFFCENITTATAEVQDEAYTSANFNTDVAHAVSQDDFYDVTHLNDTDDDGRVDTVDLTSAGFVKTNASGVLSVDGATYLTTEVDGSVTNEIQNIFQRVVTPLGTSPVAGTSTGDLTLASGTGITITGDASTDTVTIAATGAAAFSPTVDTADTTTSVVFAGDPTGAQTPHTDPGITYNASNDTLTVGVAGTGGGIDVAASSTTGGSLELKEDSDFGTSTFALQLGASNLTTNVTCVIDASGRIPDSCVGDGTDAGGTLSDGDKGDITILGGVWDIDSGTVTGTELATGAVDVSTGDVTGTMPTSKGGTGTATAGTQYGIPYYTTTTTMASTLAGTNTKVLQGNASGAPTWVDAITVNVTSPVEAQGQILYRNLTEWVNLAPGADGNQLTTHGAGANPTWDSPSVGGSGDSIRIGTTPVTDLDFLTGGDITYTLNTAPAPDTLTSTISDNSVTYAKMQNISAASLLVGRGDSGTGDPQEITLGTGLTMAGTTLNAATGSGDSLTVGLTPATDPDFISTGDIAFVLTTAPTPDTIHGTVNDNSVTYAKMQNVSAASKLLGRGDSGTGDPEEITLGTGLTMTGTQLSAAGGGASAGIGIDVTGGVVSLKYSEDLTTETLGVGQCEFASSICGGNGGILCEGTSGAGQMVLCSLAAGPSDKTVNLPAVTSASDTLVAVGVANTFTGNNTHSGTEAFSGATTFSAGATFNTTAPVFNAGATFNTVAPTFTTGVTFPSGANLTMTPGGSSSDTASKIVAAPGSTFPGTAAPGLWSAAPSGLSVPFSVSSDSGKQYKLTANCTKGGTPPSGTGTCSVEASTVCTGVNGTNSSTECPGAETCNNAKSDGGCTWQYIGLVHAGTAIASTYGIVLPNASGHDFDGINGPDPEFQTINGYNFKTSGRIDTTEYAMFQQFTWGFTDDSAPPVRHGEWFMTHQTPGGLNWHPWNMGITYIDTEKPVAHFVYSYRPDPDGAGPLSGIGIQSAAGQTSFAGGHTGHGQVEVLGNGVLYVSGTAAGWGGVLQFEGPTVNGFQTALHAAEPTAARDISLPNADGTVLLDTTPVIRSMDWGAGALSTGQAGGVTTGVCSDPAEFVAGATGAPKVWGIACPLGGTNLDGAIYGSTAMPDGWVPGDPDGAGPLSAGLMFQVTALNIDVPSGTETLQGVINAQCVSNNDVASGTWTANQNLDVVWTTADIANDTHKALAAANITPDGSCAAGDTLYWRYVVCDSGTPPTTGCTASTFDVTNVRILNVRMEYLRLGND